MLVKWREKASIDFKNWKKTDSRVAQKKVKISQPVIVKIW